MKQLSSIKKITGLNADNLVRFLDILEEHRQGLEEFNAFRHWEDVVVTTPSGVDTEFTVTCLKLNRTPIGYFIVKKDKAVDVYIGASTWIKNKLYLKASVATAIITVRVIG